MPLLAVNHHYFREVSPSQGIYPIDARRMEANIHILREHGWRLGSQSDILRYGRGELGERMCIITFDDGLKEQMQCLKLLDRLGAGAIFFVSTGPFIHRRVLAVHKMHMIRTKLSDEDVAAHLDRRFLFHAHSFDPAALVLQYRYDAELSRKVKYFLNFVLDAEQKDAWVDATFEELFGDEARVAEALYMDKEDWKILSGRGWLGTHGHQHLPLATLSTDQIQADIEASLATIREATGVIVQGIAYPFGGKTAVSKEVFRISRQCGLSYGFTMHRAINDHPEESMALHRIDVNDLPGFLS